MHAADDIARLDATPTPPTLTTTRVVCMYVRGDDSHNTSEFSTSAADLHEATVPDAS